MSARRRARTERGQGIARALAWLAAAALLTGCARPGPDRARDPAEALRRSPARPGAVVVRLAFAGEADLDLYVTGPLEETVYFANTPSRIGGRLLADLRCDTPGSGPRIETVVFDPAPPGRYRVGIDLPERCDDARGPAPWSLEVRSAREAVGILERSGVLSPGVFEPVVLEWVEPAP